MSIKSTNVQLGITDKDGNTNIMYPVTLAKNIKIINKDGSEDTLEHLLSSLGNCAYKNIENIVITSDKINPQNVSANTTYNSTAINNFYKEFQEYKNSIAQSVAAIAEDIELCKKNAEIQTENTTQAIAIIEQTVMHLEGDEEVSGRKTFIDPIIVGGNVEVESVKDGGNVVVNFTSK